MIKHALGLLALISLTSTAFAKGPLSHEVSFIESYSASEVSLKASGLGEESEDAITDLKKAAIWFVILGGTDPLVKDSDSKSRLENVEDDFYGRKSRQKYITWEAQKITGRIKKKLPNGDRGVKITKTLRVNKQMIEADLIAKGVLKDKEELMGAAGNPFIMVIPEAPKGQAPLEVLDKNNLAKHAAGAIESYLTARKYDVVVPRAMDQINNLNQLQSEIKGAEEDMSYQLALALGSDVYIVYSGEVKGGKASVVVKAYETTTGRLLGTETGYSKTRPGAPMEPLVEEAVSDAVNNVLARINTYWLDDLKKGIQYKVVFKVVGEFEEDDLEEVQFEIEDTIEDYFSKSKDNVLTDKTMDFTIWAKQDEFSKSSKIYRVFRKAVKGAKIKKISINKKLLLLGIENR